MTPLPLPEYIISLNLLTDLPYQVSTVLGFPLLPHPPPQGKSPTLISSLQNRRRLLMSKEQKSSLLQLPCGVFLSFTSLPSQLDPGCLLFLFGGYTSLRNGDLRGTAGFLLARQASALLLTLAPGMECGHRLGSQNPLGYCIEK